MVECSMQQPIGDHHKLAITWDVFKFPPAVLKTVSCNLTSVWMMKYGKALNRRSTWVRVGKKKKKHLWGTWWFTQVLIRLPKVLTETSPGCQVVVFSFGACRASLMWWLTATLNQPYTPKPCKRLWHYIQRMEDRLSYRSCGDYWLDRAHAKGFIGVSFKDYITIFIVFFIRQHNYFAIATAT